MRPNRIYSQNHKLHTPKIMGRTHGGFTLVEVVISMFILTMISLAVGMSTIMARKFAEESVYRGTALSAASSYIEQIRGMDYQSLLNSIGSPASVPLPTQIDQATADPLYLNVANTKTVMIDVNSSGVANKFMKLKVTPTLVNMEPSASLKAIDIQLIYEWQGPDGALPHKRALRAIRSYVPSF